MLREGTDDIAKLLSALKSRGDAGIFLTHGKRQIFKKGKEEDPGHHRLGNLTSVLGRAKPLRSHF